VVKLALPKSRTPPGVSGRCVWSVCLVGVPGRCVSLQYPWEAYPLRLTIPNSWKYLRQRCLYRQGAPGGWLLLPVAISAAISAAPVCRAAMAAAQAPAPVQVPAGGAATPIGTATPIGHTDAREVQVSGAVDVRNGQMQLGNGSVVTAGNQPVKIGLTRGGALRLCSTTSVHLSHDRTIDAPDSTALMMGLDRGAIEANYEVGKYSDVLMTPDLRILISGPGTADLSIRVSNNGDTCVNNHGEHAPYITISSQLEGGIYRVLPNQHVTFEHGSLLSVVDTEKEPCGCPPAAAMSVAAAGVSSVKPGAPGAAVGGPSSTPADTEFPLSVSEGLAPAPAPPTTPVVPPGEVHAQVTVPFVYHGDAPAAGSAPKSTAPETAAPGNPGAKAAVPQTRVAAGNSPPVAATPTQTVPSTSAAPQGTGTLAQPAGVPAKKPASSPGFFHRVGRGMGHFFSKVFGAE
jgi:hypothetical protein